MSMLLRVMNTMRLMEQPGVTVAVMRATHLRGSGEARDANTSQEVYVLVGVELRSRWLGRTVNWRGPELTTL